jgi:hypothetical protein
MMTEMSPNPSVSQVNESGSISSTNANIRVAKFAGQLAQSGQANGGNFNSNRIEQLASRSASAASSLPSTASVNLEGLAEAINKGESKIGIGTKFLALIISWFGGDSYDTAIAKQAFRNITTQETQTALLALAFEAAIGLDGTEGTQDMQENVQAVLEFCQEVGVKPANVLNTTIAKQLVLGLAKGGTDGARYLQWLVKENKLDVSDIPEFTDDAAKELVLGSGLTKKD